MSAPQFSVIVPTYGRDQLLHEAVESILGQTVADLECIVVDDGSPIPAVAPADSRVRLVRREDNRGPAAARNTGVAAASGRYLAFLDDDDLWVPERLELALEGLQRAPIAVCWSIRVDDHPWRRRPDQRMLEGNVGAVIREGATPNLGCTALERSVFLPFDERFLACQDVEWWIRITEHVPVATVPRVGKLQRHHDGTRHLNDTAARVTFLRMVAEVHADYFAQNPKAARFHWTRVRKLALEVGDVGTARDVSRRIHRPVSLASRVRRVRAGRAGRADRQARRDG